MSNPSFSKEGGDNKTDKGIFIVIEGTDGSGKGTQFDLLKERLHKAGYEIATFDFPQYDQPSSFFVKEYLNGNYGSSKEVGPYTGSIFYALDRYQAAPKIREAINQGKVVLANRFTGSNMAHQGTKFATKDERNGYFSWLEAIEFKMLGIPRPDLSIVLRVDAEIAQKLVDNKQSRSYTDKKRDLHEADLMHLKRAVEVYDDLCELFPNDFKQIDCVRSGQIMSIETISGLIWQTILPELPNKTNSKSEEKVKQEALKNTTKFITSKNGVNYINEEGIKEISKYVTSATGNVYAFNDQLSAVTIAAAMARLSRRGDDMRVTILDEFMGEAGKDASLLKRVITAYGDDSVQQLTGQHLVVEGASQLLTKKLEWGRLASYLEQSTRYIYFDQKDLSGKYRYYTPDYLKSDIKKIYNQTIDQIFETYSLVVHKITDYVRANSTVPESERDIAWNGATRAEACDAARPLLPAATKSTVGIFASGQALESLIMHLLSDDLPEAKETGQKILTECRKVLETFLERADKPDRGGAWQAYQSETRKNVAKMANELLPITFTDSHTQKSVILSSYFPKNEQDVVADILYEHSDSSLDSIKKEVENWNYQQKSDVIKAFVGNRLNRRQRPGRAFEQIHYSFDLLCDYGIFRDLQRHRMVDDLNWQKLSPRLGYEIPELVEKAGLSELYEKCFDLSLGLYSALQAAGYVEEAQYAVLLGHKMRWKVTLNAREAYQMLELRTSPQGHSGYRKIANQMFDKIAEVHPIIADGMKFINKDEDPELSRLAAERYTQFKLKYKKN